LPKDLKISYTQDQSTFIVKSFEAVQEHLILGGVLPAWSYYSSFEAGGPP